MLERRTIRLFALLVALLALPGFLFVGASGKAPAQIQAMQSDPTVAVMLQLDGQPALQAGMPAAVLAQSRANSRLQERIAAQSRVLGAHELYRVRLVYNGLAVVVPASRVAALAQLPGVAAIVPLTPKQRMSSVLPAPRTAPDTALVFPGGLTGNGVRIAVIDSGIDYTHATFGGPGTAAAYTANNRTILEPGTFPTLKVVGGIDLAGDSYDAASTDPNIFTAVPDPDPLDCNGHGTHVASIAAGSGVTLAGAPYAGPYTNGLNPADFLVRPGIAPQASLYAIKIFGCSGTTALLVPAIEYAVDPNADGDPSDRVADILNLSLGSPFGSNADPDAVAAANAVNAGMVVVAAAGDTNGTFYNIWSPATAPGTVAVTAHDGATPPALTPNAPRGPQRGNGFMRPDVAAPGVDIPAALFGSGNAAGLRSGSSIATAYVAGAAALIRQINPGWAPTQVKALLMNTSAPVLTSEGLPAPPSLGGAGAVNLRRLSDTGLIAYAPDPAGQVGLGFGAQWIDESAWSQSTMIRIENHTATPESVQLTVTTIVTETGVSMLLASDAITVAPDSYELLVGTLAVSATNQLGFTPAADVPLSQGGFPRHYLAEYAGMLELRTTPPSRVRLAHGADLPDLWLKLDEVADEDFLSATQVGAYRTVEPGMHRIRAYQGNPDIGTLPFLDMVFMVPEGVDVTVVVAGTQATPTIYVVNGTPEDAVPADQALVQFLNGNPQGDAQALDVYVNGNLAVAGLTLGETSAWFPLLPGTSAVAFYGAGQNPASTLPLATGNLTAVAGQAILVAASQCSFLEDRFLVGTGVPLQGEALRLPYQIFPKAGAENNAPEELTIPVDATTFALPLTNLGARNTASFGPQTPLAAAFELVARSDQITPAGATISAADLRYVGLARSANPGATIANTRLYFGLATWGAWDTPNEVGFEILIDSTGPGGIGGPDGTADFALVTSTGGPLALTPEVRDDVFTVLPYRVNADGTRTLLAFWYWSDLQAPSLGPLDSAPFNSSVLYMPVRAGNFGLNDTRTSFQYRIETRHRDTLPAGEVVDRVPTTGWFSYDLTQTALIPRNTSLGWFFSPVLFVSTDGVAVSGLVDPARLAARGQQELLLLYLHNAPPTQADIVSVRQAPVVVAPGGGSPPEPDALGLYRLFIPVITR